MGFFFTIVFIITAYLAPVTIFGTLDQYHIQTYIAALAIIFSLFSARGSNVMRLTQTWAIAGLCACVAISIMVNGWLGGGPKALLDFVPEVSTFFMIVMNCRKKWHVQALVLTLFGCAVFIICRAVIDINASDHGYHSLYLTWQNVGTDEIADWLPRIGGLSFLSDPNDFSQFLVSLIPLMFLFRVKGSSSRNFIFVYVPCSFLFYGMYLTHSRGSMVALMALCIFAFRRKIGVVRSVVIGVGMFAILTVLGYSGGRDVSAGDDRLAAWASGLMLIRAHPIFGVGWQRFDEFNDITAHNTFVVCAAELGLVGVFFWVLLMYVTVRNSWETAKDPDQLAADQQKRADAVYAKQPFLQGIPNLTEAALTPASASGGVPVSSQSHQFSGTSSAFILPADAASERAAYSGVNHLGFPSDDADSETSDAEIRQMASLSVLSFVGFLTAGWFLSRAYTMCIYVNAGIAAAIYRMATDRGIAPPPLTFGQASKTSLKIILALLTIVWVIVHVDHYMPQ